MISAGDKAPHGLLPILMMGEVKFCLLVNKEATFLPQVHATVPSPQILPVGSWGLCRPSPENLFPGRALNKGEGHGSLDNLVDQGSLSCTRGLNCRALSHCPSGLLTQNVTLSMVLLAVTHPPPTAPPRSTQSFGGSCPPPAHLRATLGAPKGQGRSLGLTGTAPAHATA